MSAIASTGRSDTVVEDVSDARLYECVVLYPYPVTPKEEQDLLKEVEAIFEEAGAKMIAKDQWGQRGLAYTIKGFSEGNFVVYHYEMDPLKLKEADHGLRILKGVLRHMLIKPPKHYEIVKYSERYVQWLKDKELRKQEQVHEEEAKIQQRVAAKAKREAKRVERARPAPKTVVGEQQITEQIDKMISDEDLNI